MVRVADAVLRAIAEAIAAQPAERGGALLGPPGRRLVSRFVPDPLPGESSAWRPSRALAAEVRAREQQEGLEWKGLVHSHPAGLDAPTAQDAREARAALQANPQLVELLVPIVTPGEPATPAAHEAALGGARLSWYAVDRPRDADDDGPPHPVPARTVPLLDDAEHAASALGAGAPELLLACIAGEDLLAARIPRGDGGELLVVAPDAYPELAPLVFADGVALPIAWKLSTPPEDRLEEALRAALADPRRDDAPPAGLPPGEDAAYDSLLARGAGLLDRSLREKTVLVAGLGSVGSALAELLVRSGVGGLALLDPEPVEAANLSRSVYELRDVGVPKPDALARRLRALSTTVRLSLHRCAVEALAPEELDGLVRGADLVLAATDGPAAQRALARFAYARGVPALFPGLHAGARGGEVVLAVPERTACFLCATRARHAAPEVGRATDYGSGRLAAEPALGVDVLHLVTAAAKLALSLLAPPGAPLADFARGPVEAGTTFLTLSTVPDYWFYPAVFEGVPGQGAYQSVWLAPERAVDCPVCGAPEHRADPLEVPLRAPGRDAFQPSTR